MAERFRDPRVPERHVPEPARRRTTPPPVRDLASLAGNAAFARLARSGAGILADGSVHPRVVSAISAAEGGGKALGGQTSRWAVDAFGDSMRNVRLHTGGVADSLARAVSARAFTVGRSVFFAAGQYRPHMQAGRRLLAHELAHVVQQEGAPTSGPLRVTSPGDAHERAAAESAESALG
jgi:uncharacterized protein DUF4157